MNPTKHRKRMLEIFFEKFQVPAVYVAVQGVLSLYIFWHLGSLLESQLVLSWILEMESLMSFLFTKDIHLLTLAKEWTSQDEM